MKKTIAMTILSLAALTSVSAMAQEVQGKWYGGVGLGQSNLSYNSDDFRVNPSIAAAGFSPTTYDRSSDLSYSLYGGYRLSKSWSAKVEYTNFGKENWGYNIAGGNANSDLKIEALSLSAVGTYPVADKFSLLGEAGAYYYEATRSPTHSGTVVPLTSNPETSKANGFKPFASIGVQYDVTPKVALIGKYTYYGEVGSQDKFGRVKLSNASLNLQYSF